MSRTSEYLPEKIYEYLTSVSVREPPILRKLREETASHPMGGMQIPPEHGQFLALLMQLIGARRTLEVGVFTGYSSLAVALALPDEGKILACDVSEESTSVARRYWKEAGVDHMIELRLKPALETLHELIAQRQHNRYDFAFIDADKANYEGYYECALELVRPGGLIAIDNVLWHGRVIDPEANDADTLAIRAINKKLLGDSRVAISMLPVSDGLTLACKR
jgi:predicted O-methyltransferase YrrM